MTTIREATDDDLPAIAALHAASWRHSYRGQLSDHYLDNEVDADRQAIWSGRFSDRSGTLTLVAEQSAEIVAFAHVLIDQHPMWGSLLDNLHVSPTRHRAGHGRQLMAALAAGLDARRCHPGLHLEVIDGNAQALAFYTVLGGRPAGRHIEHHGGSDVTVLRMVWADRADFGGNPSSITVRPARPDDDSALLGLWERCGLIRPWNDPRLDIERKRALGDDLLLIAMEGGTLVGSAMIGYDGHRGWVNYLAVDPSRRGTGIGRHLMVEAEVALFAVGCPKINLQVRSDNQAAIAFYENLGYLTDAAISMGRRLVVDSAP